MKKIFKPIAVVATAALFMITPNNSNAQAFEEESMYISLGYGGPNLSASFFKTFEDRADYTVNGLGPIHAKFEYAVSDKIGIGMSFNYVRTNVKWNYETIDVNNDPVVYEEGYKFSALAANARINWHFVDNDNLDVYYGLGFGYNYSNNEYYTNDPDGVEGGTFSISGIPIGFETTFGVRYLFNENIGIYAEFGWAKSVVQGGLVFKIGQ